MNCYFLTEGFYRDSSKLKDIRKRGFNAPITDFNILLGSNYFDEDDYDYEYTPYNCYYKNKDRLENRTADYCVDSFNQDGVFVDIMGHDGMLYPAFHDLYNYSVRLVVSYSDIMSRCNNINKADDGVLEGYCGFYPQQAASIDVQEKLEKCYEDNLPYIKKTGKEYVVMSDKVNGKIDNVLEYEFVDGKRYVRVENKNDGIVVKLSNRKFYRKGDYVWVEVQPVKWLIDLYDNIALSESLLFPAYNMVRYGKDENLMVLREFIRNNILVDMMNNRLDYNKESIKVLKRNK